MRLVLLGVVLLGIVSSVRANPVTPDRVAALPAEQRAAWEQYLERSAAWAAKDQAVLDAEVKAAGLAEAVRAPDGGDFKMPAQPGDAWFAGDEAAKLADVVLSFQTPSGGWSKHSGYSKGPRQPGMLFSSQYAPGAKPHYLATFDNRSTVEQILFLAGLWQATQRQDCRDAVVRGIGFILEAQYPNGGWPQVYPLEGGYHDGITFNDDAMTRVVRLLKAIHDGDPSFAFIDTPLRTRVSEAMQRGLDCILRLQVPVNGKPSVWSAQYDAITLAPAAARAFEPATLSGQESVRVLELLMSVKNPPPELVQRIESALAWYDSARITDVRRVQQDGRTTYVVDPASTEVYWARFYHLETGKPVFPGRDGVLHETYEQMAQGRSINYNYYTTQPGSLLNVGQKRWRAMLAGSAR